MNCDLLLSLEICLEDPTVRWVSRSSVNVAVTAQGSTPAGRSRSSETRTSLEAVDDGVDLLFAGCPRSTRDSARVRLLSRSEERAAATGWGTVGTGAA